MLLRRGAIVMVRTFNLSHKVTPWVRVRGLASRSGSGSNALVHSRAWTHATPCSTVFLTTKSVACSRFRINTAARLVTRTRKHEHNYYTSPPAHALAACAWTDWRILLLPSNVCTAWHLGIWLSCSCKTGHIRPFVRHLQINWWHPGLFSKLMETEPSAILHASCGTVCPSTCASVIPWFLSRLDWKLSFLSVLSGYEIILTFMWSALSRPFRTDNAL